MLDLKLLNKVNEVEKQTEQSLPNLLSKVPLGNVLTAFKELQIADLVEMVSSVAQMIYAIPTAILTPLLLWLFLHQLQLSFESIFAVGTIVGTIQWLGTEIYFRRKLNKKGTI